MKGGRNLGDVVLVKAWLRQIYQAKEVMCFEFPLVDGSKLQTVETDPKRIQLFRCVEHIAHILQIPILYKYKGSSLSIEIQVDEVEYFEYWRNKDGE